MNLHNALKPLYIFTRFLGHAPYKFEKKTKVYKFDILALIFVVVTIISSILSTIRQPSKNTLENYVFYDFVVHLDCVCTLINVVTLLIKLRTMLTTLTEMDVLETKLKILTGKLEYKNIFRIYCVVIFIFVTDTTLKSLLEYIYFFGNRFQTVLFSE